MSTVTLLLLRSDGKQKNGQWNKNNTDLPDRDSQAVEQGSDKESFNLTDRDE